MKTRLDEYQFQREQEFQQIQWLDIWHQGEGVHEGVGYTQIRDGVTTEGIGEGIRILANTNLRPCDIASLLRQMADYVDEHAKHKAEPRRLEMARSPLGTAAINSTGN